MKLKKKILNKIFFIWILKLFSSYANISINSMKERKIFLFFWYWFKYWYLSLIILILIIIFRFFVFTIQSKDGGLFCSGRTDGQQSAIIIKFISLFIIY